VLAIIQLASFRALLDRRGVSSCQACAGRAAGLAALNRFPHAAVGLDGKNRALGGR
jgi:hypothetical protein